MGMSVLCSRIPVIRPLFLKTRFFHYIRMRGRVERRAGGPSRAPLGPLVEIEKVYVYNRVVIMAGKQTFGLARQVCRRIGSARGAGKFVGGDSIQ